MNGFLAQSAVAAAIGLSCGLTGAALGGVPVIAPDNGAGTVDLPPAGGVYTTPDDNLAIIDGLPAGTTIDIDGSLHSFFYMPGGVFSIPTQFGVGGSLGGDISNSWGTMQMPMLGTGALLGYNRNIPLPVSFEIHSAPRGAPFSSPQSFDSDMFRLFGQVVGDPDFDLLRIVGGTDFGLPSPGHTTLTDVGGGMWNVQSFFDITWRIDFVGAPGGPLGGMSGSTTGTTRFVLGIPAPASVSLLALGGAFAARRRR